MDQEPFTIIKAPLLIGVSAQKGLIIQVVLFIVFEDELPGDLQNFS